MRARPQAQARTVARDGLEQSQVSWVIPEHLMGGLYPFSRNLITFFCPCHNFFPLSSVQIIIIPACCLLCVL